MSSLCFILILGSLHVYDMTAAAHVCPVGKRKKAFLLTGDSESSLPEPIAVWRRVEFLDKIRVL